MILNNNICRQSIRAWHHGWGKPPNPNASHQVDGAHHCRRGYSQSCRSASSVSGKHRGHLQEWKLHFRQRIEWRKQNSLQSDFCLAFSCARFRRQGYALCRCNWAKNGTRSHLAQPISALAAPAGGWSSPESPRTLCHSILPKRKALLGQATKTMPGLRQGCDEEALAQPIADLPVQGFGFELAFLKAFQM